MKPRARQQRYPTAVPSLTLYMLAYTVLLQLSYQHLVAPRFAYLGYTYRGPAVVEYGLAIAVVWLIAVLMPRSLNRPSAVILWVHFLVATAPTILIGHYANILSTGEATTFSIGVAVCWLVVVAATQTRLRPAWKVPRVEGADSHIWVVLTGVSVATVGWLLLTSDLHPELVSLTAVTDLRLDYRAFVAQAPLALVYAIAIVSYVVNPLLIARGWANRAVLPATLGCLGQLAIYSVTGYKSVLLSIPVTIGLVLLFRGHAARSSQVLPAVLVAAMLVAVAVDVAFGWSALTLLVVTRFLVTPGVLAAGYVDIFSALPELRWSYSFLSGYFDYPYLELPAHLVGSVLSGSEATSANVNLFADGYMNLRWTGVIIECLVLIVTLWAADSASRGLPLSVAVSLFVVPTVSLANSSIFTTLTTHGLLAALIICAILPRSGWDEDIGPRVAGQTGRTELRAPQTANAQGSNG